MHFLTVHKDYYAPLGNRDGICGNIPGDLCWSVSSEVEPFTTEASKDCVRRLYPQLNLESILESPLDELNRSLRP